MDIPNTFIDLCRDELQDVVNRMLAGLTNWEEYVALQARAATILEMREFMTDTIKRQDTMFEEGDE